MDYKGYYRRNLPHFQPQGAILFVTFRLFGSIPKSVLEECRDEILLLTRKREAARTPDERKTLDAQVERFRFLKFEQTLDSARSGPLWLKEQQVASLIVDCLQHRNESVYSLDAFCVMANHVHAVFRSLGQPLAKILQSLKGFTARHANKVLGRTGPFWEHESFDRVIRNEDEWNRVVQYVLNNPVKAGLVDDWRKWPWSYFKYGKD